MKGGARAISGPAPDPNAIRRDRASDQATWTTLPAAGRQGETPAWPLSQPMARELELWATEWIRPQAIVWERNGQATEVAMYVRTLVAAEAHNAPAALRTLVKQQQEALGLSLPGMLRLRWRIEELVAEPERRATGTETASVKRRFKVVAGGA